MFQNHFFDLSAFPISISRSTFKRLAWFFMCFYFCLPIGWTQDPDCLTPLCERMSVEIIRAYPNVEPDCSDNEVLCGDRFYQMFYTVYLKYNDPSPASPTVPFLLDYSQLNIKVDLKPVNDFQHSHINIDATTKCFEVSTNGSLWSSYSTSDPDEDSDKVLFNVDAQSVLISFQNLNTGGYCGGNGGGGSNRIPFEYSAPSGAASCYGVGHECAYAELFTIVVDVWPDEYIQFSFDSNVLEYIQSDETSCSPLDEENAGTNNGLSSTQVDFPDPFTSTENDYIQLQLSGPNAGTDEQYFTLVLDNDAAHNFTLDLVEFYVRVALENYDEDITFGGDYTPIEILSMGADPINSGYEAYLLHYIIDDGSTLNSLSPKTLGTIHIHEPTIISKNYSILLEPEGGRLKTTYSGSTSVCTSLDVSGSGEFTESSNFNPCPSSDIQFKIEKVTGNDCTDPYQLKVGFYNSASSVTKSVRRVEFDLEIEMDAGVSISSVDYTNWGNPSSLYGLFSGPSVTDISGNVFKYLFSTTNGNALNFLMDGFTNYMVISFSHTGEVCIKGIKITNLLITYANESGCIPPISNPINPATQTIALSICGPKLYGYIKTETGVGIDEVTVTANPPSSPSSPCFACSPNCDPVDSEESVADGGYGFCTTCSTCTHFLITPEKDDNPLNGITTYDLVLISKHILGLEPLGSPYKMIAADASNSSSITTFDIVEIRKLILGINQNFTNNTSWRFVDAETVLNSVYPFGDFLAHESINCVDPTDNTSIDFIGIKIGDVNNSVVPSRPTERPVTTLSFGKTANKPDDIITIPIIYTGTLPMEAIQLGIRFDPSRLVLIGPSRGDIPSYSDDNFGLNRVSEGEIRTLWLPMTDEFEKILPGQTLFYLSFQVLAKKDLPESLLYIDDNILPNAAWMPDGTEYAIQSSSNTADRKLATTNQFNALQAFVQPNPTSGIAALTVTTTRALNGQIGIYGAFGTQIFLREFDFTVGQQIIEMPEIGNLPAGVYFWKLFGAEEQVQGHLIKQ